MGKPIVDAEKELTINVMRKDIWKAEPQKAEACAIAQSLRRGKNIGEVRVGATMVLVEQPKKVVRYVIKGEHRRKIKTFDKSGYFEPTKITLLPPPENKKLGARKGTKPGSNVRKGEARTVYNSPPLRHALRVVKKDVQINV